MKPLHPAALCALTFLAACSGGGDKAATPNGDKSASVAAARSFDCKDLPAYAPLPNDAVISLCTSGQTRPGHVSGTVTYSTGMAPDAVIAFYKDKVSLAGLHKGINAPGAFSAVDGGKRSMMVMPAAGENGKTYVTLNWGRNE